MLLELKDIEVEYRRKGRSAVRAVAGVSLGVDRGQIVGLVGETGCGKSTLARVAAGIVAPTVGEALFEGRPLRALSRRARSADDVRVQMVFQDPNGSLNPRRRVGDQIEDGLMRSGLNKADRKRRVRELLERVGLPPEGGRRFPHQYSGGQKQRLAIARALAASPSLIVLDEPLSSLDVSAQAQIANLLRELCDELDVGLLLISHDLAIVQHVADVVCVMYLGTRVEQSPASDLWSDPQHPYTQALIQAVPEASGSGLLPEALEGEVPDPGNPPTGCRFHPRCPHAAALCRQVAPPLVETARTHTLTCWQYESKRPDIPGPRLIATPDECDVASNPWKAGSAG